MSRNSVPAEANTTAAVTTYEIRRNGVTLESNLTLWQANTVWCGKYDADDECEIVQVQVNTADTRTDRGV